MPCVCEHEGYCNFEALTGRKRMYRKHPCKFAIIQKGDLWLRTCTAKEEDLTDENGFEED